MTLPELRKPEEEFDGEEFDALSHEIYLYLTGQIKLMDNPKQKFFVVLRPDWLEGDGSGTNKIIKP
jgi:hypothetical protein